MLISLTETKAMQSLAILLTMLLAACQSAGPCLDSSVLEQVQTELEQSRAASLGARGPPKQVLNALVPEIAFTEDDAAAVDSRFDFSVKDAMPVREFSVC